MKHGGIIGAIVGVALFGVGYASYDSFVYLIFIPIAGLMGYYAPALLAGDEF
jgi:hypothetical protein